MCYKVYTDFSILVGCICFNVFLLNVYVWLYEHYYVMYLSTINLLHDIYLISVCHASFPSRNNNKPSKNSLLAVTSGICSARAAYYEIPADVKQTTKPCMLCKGILLKWLHIQQPVAIFGLPSRM